MRSAELRVVIKPPGERPYEKTIPHTLEALQKEVGGYVEAVRFRDLLLLVNEEGKLRLLPPNIRIDPHGWLVGTLVLLAQDQDDEAEFASLSDEQVAAALQQFAE